MKKTLFMAIMAGVALAGCVKNEPIAKGDGSPEPIKFEAPLVSIPTKATEIADNYPKDKDFAVFALYHPGDFSSFNAADAKLYMSDVTCDANKKGETETPDYWVPASTYYWPKTGKLTFAAYAPAKTPTSPAVSVWPADATVAWGETGFTFTNFTVDDTPANQYDLLYSGRVYNQTSASMATDNPYDGVTILFQHALSSIVFKAKTEADYSGTTITITGITVNNVIKKGSFNQNIANDTSGDSNTPQWTLGTDTKEYVAFTGSKTLSNTESFVGEDPSLSNGKRRSDLILIPQALNADGRIVTVTVNYTIKHDGETQAIDQVATFNLGTESVASWDIGKRYTYNIIIGLDKIYFNPTVANWTDASNTGIDVQTK